MFKKYFGTDGIRGRVNDEKINGEIDAYNKIEPPVTPVGDSLASPPNVA